MRAGVIHRVLIVKFLTILLEIYLHNTQNLCIMCLNKSLFYIK